MNMARISIVIFWLLWLVLRVTSLAAQGDEILGVWNNEEKDAKIEIYKCDDKYCGKIIFLKEPNYASDFKEGVPGTPKLDHKNPDAAKRSRPILGLQIVNGFVSSGKNVWTGGTVYDPKSGNTYRGNMTLVSPKQLDLRGFIGIPLFGRSTTWTRP